MSFPTTRESLRERWDSGEVFDFYLFYGHKPQASGVDKSCFSQWFVREFSVDGIVYPTAEHWMMAEKARLFEDSRMVQSILASESPRDAKAFGRKVQGFDPDVWDQRKFEIVVRGNEAKLSQHEDMKKFLLDTANFDSNLSMAGKDSKPSRPEEESVMGLVAEERAGYELDSPASKNAGVILVEAAGRDCIWGIGLGEKNPKALDPFTWRGRNLLGFALTVVRESFLDSEVV